MAISTPDIGYIAYIDESGDIGLRTVVPIDPKGASEWLVIAAVVVRAENEQNIAEWLRDIRVKAKSTQSPDLHFKTLSDAQATVVCGELAERDLRIFVVISNKQNMRQHRNERAAKVSGTKHYIYWFLCRLLLERVTEFCEDRNKISGTPWKKLRVEFSKRSDLNYTHLTNYLTKLWLQDGVGRVFLNKGNIRWSVFDHRHVFAYDHRSRAGLQLADVAASAFYRAINRDATNPPNPLFAKLLKPRVWPGHRRDTFDTGFKVLPFPLRVANLTDDQKEVFREYGYPQHMW